MKDWSTVAKSMNDERRTSVQSDTSLYIPMGVKTENELFNGFGKRELLQSTIGGLIGGACACILYLITQNVAMTVVCVLTGVFGSVMMTTRDLNNQSVVDQIGNMIRFNRSQQIYPYRYLDEWNLQQESKVVKQSKK